jgi:hypothetical protein
MYADRVAFYTPTTGTGGSLDVGDAIDGSVYTPAEAGVEDGAGDIHYTIRQGTDVEFCTGGYAEGTPSTLTRTTVKSKIGGVAGTDPIDLNGTAVVAFVADAALFDLMLTVAGGKTLTGGFTADPHNLGNITSFTVDGTLGQLQYGTNHGAFTLTAPTADTSVDILVVNDGSAGAVIFSDFTTDDNTGDPLDTVNGHKFIISVRRIAGVSTYLIKKLQ